MKALVSRLMVLTIGSALSLSAGSMIVGVDNTGNYFPFGFPVTGPGSQYQEAYSSSLFSGSISITGIDFFLQPGGLDNALYEATFTLSLSTITTDVNDLSDTNLNSNVGANNTLFTTVDLSGLSGNELNFAGFPFLYDPAAGNLLLDIQITNINCTGAAAFEDDGPDGPPTIARYQNFGTGTSGFGLVTEFDFSSQAPEPGSLGLIAIGLTGMILCIRGAKMIKRWSHWPR